MFTLNTKLIPALNRDGIKFRYIGGVYDPMTIIVTHKSLDICRIDMNRISYEPYNYNVYWFASTVKNARCLKRQYLISQELIDDIRKVIHFEYENKGEDKMDKKMYKVIDMKVRSNSITKDEITLVVNPLRSNSFGLTDCDRIREAIESIKIHEDSIDALTYCKADVISTYRLVQMFNKSEIKDVIFNNPATIVFWADGTKTVVKAENEEFDPEKGLAMAIAKRALGGKHDYYDVFKKYVGRYEKKQKKGEK